MFTRLRFLFLALVCGMLSVLPVSADAERVALVIGNSNYSAVEALPNPQNDARAIATALTNYGFEVTTALDLSREQMYETLRSFRSLADQAEIALVYYAGHGIEIGGTNFLVPVDARLEDVRDAPVEMVQVDDVLSQLSGARGLRMIVLDACRNNPFEAQLRNGSSSRAVGRGLSIVNSAEAGTMIVYAAAAGQVVPDGHPGDNSPFTSAFLSALSQPPMDVRLLMGHVRDEMARRAAGIEPYVYQSLGGGQFVINAPVMAAVQPEPVQTDDEMEQDFRLAGTMSSDAAWQAFLEKYADQADHLLYRIALGEHRNALKPDQPVLLTPEPKPEPEPDRHMTIAEPAVPEMTGDQAARAIQTTLKERNCLAGPVDGILGRGSRAALARFEDVVGIRFDLPASPTRQDIVALAKTISSAPDGECPTVARASPQRTRPASTAPARAQPAQQAPVAAAPRNAAAPPTEAKDDSKPKCRKAVGSLYGGGTGLSGGLPICR